MEREPLVSVIVPVYNVEKYLHQCVDSIINQTYRNLEIILVDDGSPDNCGAICDEYALKDRRILVIHQENQGLSAARNAGLDIAQGEYIYFLDSDDYIEPCLIEKAISAMNRDTDMVYFGSYKQYTDTHMQECIPEIGLYELSSEIERCRFIAVQILHNRIGWEVWKRIFRRVVIEKYHLRFEDNKRIFAEDLYFFLCYCAHARKIVGLSDCLHHYRIREESIMGENARKLNIDRMNELAKAVRFHYQGYDDCEYLLKAYPMIHYLILDIEFRIAFRNGITMKELRPLVYADIRNRDEFRTQLQESCRAELLFYQFLEYQNAAYKLNFCQYLIDGSYNGLRVRSKLMNVFRRHYKFKGHRANKAINDLIRK